MENLPIHAKAEEIIALLRKNQVVIVVGETGSGKTTQLPPLLYGESFGEKGAIAITEPRRIAATSVARFVANELGVTLGREVGYKVRFDDRTSRDTVIKFLTDGMLLKEIQNNNPDLAGYSVVMLDEAHERNANIDLLLGLLKRLVVRRPELKVVVSSATIDAEKFSRYFNGAPVVEVSGRLHPIKIVWGAFPALRENDDEAMANAVAEKVASIHRNETEGDVLVFMPGADTINAVMEKLEDMNLRDIVLLPAHGGLPPEEQEKVFAVYQGKRKVVIATNIAETSITIDGIVYVVDSGLIKETHFHPLSGIQSLDVVEHSQSGCAQRAGRAGRTRPGVCFRLYRENNFTARPLYTEPEIKRTGLASVVLQMEVLGIAHIPHFEFLDPPEPEAFREAYEILIALGAVKKGKPGLTEIGQAMADLPLDPTIGRMLLEALKHGCESDVATVAAFFSLPKGVFMRPKGKEDEADYAHRRFKNNDSDALTYLAVWGAYAESGYSRAWCYENFLNSRALSEAKSIREQLLEILNRRGAGVSEAKDEEEAVMKSVAAGLVYNLAGRAGLGFGYLPILRRGVISQEAFVHPGSAMFGGNRFAPKPRWLVAHELVRTTKLWMRGCSRVEPEWLPELAPARFSFGKPEFISYAPPSNTVRARRPILFCSDGYFALPDIVGWKEEEMPLLDARLIQKERVERAERDGWVLLRSASSLSAWRNGQFFRLDFSQEISPREGRWYYCSVKPGLSSLDHLIATPHFEVLDLGDGLLQQQGERGEARSPKSGNGEVMSFSAEKGGTRETAGEPTPRSVEDLVSAFNKKFGVVEK